MGRTTHRPRSAARRTCFGAERSVPRGWSDLPTTAPPRGDGRLRVSGPLQGLLECSFDGMLIVARGGRISHANPPAARLFGRPLEAIVGKRVTALGAASIRTTVPDPAAPEFAHLKQYLFKIERPDQSSIEVMVRKLPGLVPPAQVWMMRTATSELAALQALERNSRLLMEAERVGGVGGWELDVESGLVVWTPEMRRIMGMPAETTKMTMEESYIFFTEASRSIVREAFNATLARGTPYDLVLEAVTAKGERIWVREVCRATMRKGRLVSVIGFTQDITEQHRLAALLNDIGNQERARIGADLHDGLGQELTGLALLLRSLAIRAERAGSVLAPELCGLSTMASKSIETVREIAHGLLPLKMSHVGFRDVLRRLARTSGATFGVRVRVRFHGDPAPMTAEIGENLYRIAQEAIANAVKHGHAARVTLRVRASETRITLTVTDDGSGIDMSTHDEGMGLQIMRYRTRMLGGLLDVHRVSRGGTRLRCVMPRNALSS